MVKKYVRLPRALALREEIVANHNGTQAMNGDTCFSTLFEHTESQIVMDARLRVVPGDQTLGKEHLLNY